MAKPNTTIAILAGGSGTRFWPAGRRSRPKQLLALDGDDPRSLLALTWMRLAPLTAHPPRIVAPRTLRRPLTQALPDLEASTFLWEPEPRNTAAAVALAAHAGGARDPAAPVLVVPADHHAAPLTRYRQALRAMVARARQGEAIVTLGLAPTRAATGYGYLRRGKRVAGGPAGPIHKVKKYVEKPKAAKARRMVADGRHSWNGGTFAFRPDVFLSELEAHLPEVAEPLEAAFARFGKRGFVTALAKAYADMPSTSVDYGVMEHARNVEVLVSDVDWDDLGSWDAVARHRKPDQDGNTLRGAVSAVGSRNCLVQAEGGHVALLGVKNLIVVQTGDTVLVARRGRGEDVRKVVARLVEEGREDLLA